MLSKNEKDTLHDVDERIHSLERRLENARASRDGFVQHLRGKYPSWRPPLPALSGYHEANFYQPQREPLLSRLSTSNYQWDVDKQRRPPPRIQNFPSSRNMDIPTSGPLLESDLRRSRIRLREISDELRALRMDRMSLSTEQWMQTEQFRQHRALRLSLSTDSPRQIDHLDEARSRLATMDFTEHSPVETPDREKKIELEMREIQEKMIDDIRNGRIPMGEPRIPETLASSAPGVRFQEPSATVVAPPVTVPATVIPVATVQQVATAPVAPIAAPTPAPVVDEPKQEPTSSLLSNISNMFKFDDSDSDSDRPAPAPPAPKPTLSAPKPYDSSILKSFISGGGNGHDSDSDNDNYFSKRKKPAKSIMFQDEGDDDFFS